MVEWVSVALQLVLLSSINFTLRLRYVTLWRLCGVVWRRGGRAKPTNTIGVPGLAAMVSMDCATARLSDASIQLDLNPVLCKR